MERQRHIAHDSTVSNAIGDIAIQYHVVSR
jgi:hypothetical protein